MPILTVQLLVKCPKDNKDVDLRTCFRNCPEWRHKAYVGVVNETMMCGFGEVPAKEPDSKFLQPKHSGPVTPDRKQSRSQLSL